MACDYESRGLFGVGERMTDEEQTIKDLIMDALSIDGEHHKQWYLEEIARRLGLDIPNFAYEEGIAP